MYSDADLFLLDDPLSALDAEVRWLVVKKRVIWESGVTGGGLGSGISDTVGA